MDTPRDALADDITALKAALASERAKALDIAAELAVARAKASEDSALIAQQKLRIAKLERQVYGQRSERSSRLIEQLALTFEELESSATEDELAAEKAIARTTTVRGFTRTRAERNTFPDHLPRERVVIDPPTACECCGGNRLRKLGEDVTRTLESVPRQWKVVETVREKFTCRDCEKISQAPSPFHVIPRGWAGPSLLAMLLFEKFGQHQPLNRQTERYALEGVPISLSTAADAVGACCTVLEPLSRLLEAHVMAAERLHGDDTTVPVLALGKCDVARCWVYVKDDRPFGGSDPPAAMFYYSRDRRGEHPQAHLANYSGILQADVLGLSGKRPVGSMPGARSSPWRILRKTRGAKRPERRRSSSRPSPWRSCAASTPSSQLSARSMVKVPITERLSARRRARRWSPIWKPICASSAPSSPAVTIWPRP
jgi:transposase